MEVRWRFVLGISLVILLVVGSFLYFALAKPKNNLQSSQILVNPAADLNLEEARQQFNEGFIFYLLAVLHADDLHSPPLSKAVPEIEFSIDNELYSASIEKGKILIIKERASEPDIRIVTSKDEVIAMMKSPSYLGQSFHEGKSNLELIADKTTLFAKGYLRFYQQLTGKSVTGGVIGIYTS